MNRYFLYTDYSATESVGIKLLYQSYNIYCTLEAISFVHINQLKCLQHVFSLS